VVSPDEQVELAGQRSRILVPMKLGLIGEEMIATAVSWRGRGSASRRSGDSHAHVEEPRRAR
jgi:hypothetical protein